MNVKPNDELHRLIVDVINAGICGDVTDKIDYYDADLLNVIASATDNYDTTKILEYIFSTMKFYNRASDHHYQKRA